ncbi:branched-chain amino acid transaminase [Steroidobacter sp. S1-65]|uniref:Branched-chain-amino-acid aminotransferase n=1 Tax=Steroidobacter gossypii TaxID=2805490 RepID=A0ABS1WXM7_9GAMM|nr:branched-chain amino acid transaminase [Steroidobacter gossypii]MBM0105692.1 branched-chain amino acid transaminase [Steroidobacter gossypii]
MPINAAKHIWYNGKLVPWDKAQVHVLAHALHYGSTVFEGERAYPTPHGPIIFRLKDHTRRLFDSAKIYHMEIPYTPDEISAACKEIINVNGLTKGAYLRPFAFRGYGEIGVAPKISPPIETVIAAFEWGAYLGAEGLENGIDVMVSSWQRLAPNTIPAMGKAAGNYLSSQLISMEAKRLGFAEGIGLGVDGSVSEGAGENLFVIRDGVIYTPGLANSILQGITRDTVITLARAHGFEVREQAIPREFLYLADEMFMTGTAAEVTPVRSVDKVTIGAGKRGPITEAIQTAFFGLFTGKTADKWGWLEPCEDGGAKQVATG